MDLLLLLRLILEGEFHVEPDILYARRDVLWTPEEWAAHDRQWRERDRIAATVRAARAAHGFYADCRSIIRGSRLDAGERQALVRVTYREEARFHPRTAGRLLSQTRRRLGRRLGRSPA